MTSDGYRDHSDTITVKDGELAKFIWRFKRLPSETPQELPKQEAEAPKREKEEPPVTEAPKSTAPGSLSIGIIGGGWATVYINGKALSQTAPLMGHTLKPGKYNIRVVNADLGLDKAQTIEIKSGAKERLNIRP